MFYCQTGCKFMHGLLWRSRLPVGPLPRPRRRPRCWPAGHATPASVAPRRADSIGNPSSARMPVGATKRQNSYCRPASDFPVASASHKVPVTVTRSVCAALSRSPASQLRIGRRPIQACQASAAIGLVAAHRYWTALGLQGNIPFGSLGRDRSRPAAVTDGELSSVC
jgi:hypothetical protein